MRDTVRVDTCFNCTTIGFWTLAQQSGKDVHAVAQAVGSLLGTFFPGGFRNRQREPRCRVSYREKTASRLSAQLSTLERTEIQQL